jgi:hypothetical protein
MIIGECAKFKKVPDTVMLELELRANPRRQSESAFHRYRKVAGAFLSCQKYDEIRITNE